MAEVSVYVCSARRQLCAPRVVQPEVVPEAIVAAAVCLTRAEQKRVSAAHADVDVRGARERGRGVERGQGCGERDVARVERAGGGPYRRAETIGARRALGRRRGGRCCHVRVLRTQPAHAGVGRTDRAAVRTCTWGEGRVSTERCGREEQKADRSQRKRTWSTTYAHG